ncbi:hypothetical protein Vadar_026628 [Vaccinium darrowii]|uniref:Uncharacterized protein n=1 Tax=Vaccinium darrowii TaxID=229202 RepID=A0ACB7XUT7_9ERIC|nr:hypothetical protein Vadar_026628 [Vaccinium darrowii]
MTSSFNPSEGWIRPPQLSETEREAANDPRNVKQSGCCNQNSLIVYQRVFRANQCLSSSRKLGPNFPRMWKKTRMTRRKATTYDIFKSLIAAEDRQMPLKKGMIRKQKATNFGYR